MPFILFGSFFSIFIFFFCFLTELFSPYVIENWLTKILQYTKINSLQLQFIFFCFLIFVELLLIILIKRLYVNVIDFEKIYNTILRFLLFVLLIIILLFVLFSLTISIIMFLKVILGLLLSLLNVNKITYNLINMKSLKSVIYKLLSCNDYSNISNEDWNMIWESINHSNDINIVDLKIKLFNQYNSLISILNSSNFFSSLKNLNDLDMNDIAKIREIFNSNDFLENLKDIYWKLENINLTFNNLKYRLNSSEISIIYNSLPLFKGSPSISDFISNIEFLNIEANMISNLLLDNSNVVFNTNIGTLIFSFLTGVYVNNLEGLYKMLTVLVDFSLAKINNLSYLIPFLIVNLVFGAFTIYLMRRITINFVMNIKEFLVQIFTKPKETYINQYYYNSCFIDWCDRITKFIFNNVLIIFLDFLITIIILFLIKIITISNSNFSIIFINSNILFNILFCVFLFLSNVLTELILKFIKRSYKVNMYKKVINTYNLNI